MPDARDDLLRRMAIWIAAHPGSPEPWDCPLCLVQRAGDALGEEFDLSNMGPWVEAENG